MKFAQEKTRKSLQPVGSGQKPHVAEGIRKSLPEMSPKQITKMFFDGTIDSSPEQVLNGKRQDQLFLSQESKLSELQQALRNQRHETQPNNPGFSPSPQLKGSRSARDQQLSNGNILIMDI